MRDRKNNIFIFKQSNSKYWADVAGELFQTIQSKTMGSCENFKDFQVKISPIEKNKTPKQLRGIHRLINVISKQLREWGNLEYTEEVVKEYIKLKAGFTTLIDPNVINSKNGNEHLNKSDASEEVTRSFKYATLQELKDIISFTEAWGKGELGIEDCYLEPKELRDMEEYFKK